MSTVFRSLKGRTNNTAIALVKPFWRKRESEWDRGFHPLWIIIPPLASMLIALLLAVPANHFAHDHTRATASENAATTPAGEAQRDLHRGLSRIAAANCMPPNICRPSGP